MSSRYKDEHRPASKVAGFSGARLYLWPIYMAKIHNKAALADKFKQGNTGKAESRTGWYRSFRGLAMTPKDPLQFANSNELAKMKRKR